MSYTIITDGLDGTGSAYSPPSHPSFWDYVDSPSLSDNKRLIAAHVVVMAQIKMAREPRLLHVLVESRHSTARKLNSPKNWPALD